MNASKGEPVPLKFFIQKDLNPDIIEGLSQTIRAFGGNVVPTVPRSGYILIMPSTTESKRLLGAWQSPTDRPYRYFLPWTYVEECKRQCRRVPLVFVQWEKSPGSAKDGKANEMGVVQRNMRFFVWNDTEANVKDAVTKRIQHSGGTIVNNANNADVILMDPTSHSFNSTVSTYTNPNRPNGPIQVESIKWVKRTVDSSELVFTPYPVRNVGGRKPGEERIPFTTADERHLCEYIAKQIPYKATGGRTGNKLYQQLTEVRAHEPGFEWVQRHPWQSWRERYKKNQDRLDKLIEKIVEGGAQAAAADVDAQIVQRTKREAGGPRSGYTPSHTAMQLDRANDAGGEFDHKDPDLSIEQTDDDAVGSLDPDYISRSQSSSQPKLSRHDLEPKYIEANSTNLLGPPPMNPYPTLPGGPMDPRPAPPFPESSRAIRFSPDGECTAGPSRTRSNNKGKGTRKTEREEEDDEDDWQIKVGNDPPPAWGSGENGKGKGKVKRGRESETGLGEVKRVKRSPSHSLGPEPSPLPYPPCGPYHEIQRPGPLASQLGREFWFLPEEVALVLERMNGDETRARQRLGEMRAVLRREFEGSVI